MTNSDESAQHAFELRRHLGVIHSQATLLEDEAFGPITADQRDALEEIIAASLALTGETATTVEPAVEGYVTDHDAQILEESPSELASPVTPTEIVLALDRDDEFVDLLARQFERAGYTTQSVTEAAELPALLERPEPQHLVLDCRFPSGPFLESLERTINATDGETAVTLVSTVVAPLMNADRGGDADTDAGTNADGDADTNVDTDQVSVAPAGAGPLQGLAGILSPTVSVRTLEALFEARFGLTAALLEADTTVAVVGDVDERFLETLEAVTDCGHSNERDAYVSSVHSRWSIRQLSTVSFSLARPSTEPTTRRWLRFADRLMTKRLQSSLSMSCRSRRRSDRTTRTTSGCRFAAIERRERRR